MNLEQIRGIALDDLVKAEADAREELFKLRYAATVESVDNTAKIREVRKRIARIKTIHRERTLAAAQGS